MTYLLAKMAVLLCLAVLLGALLARWWLRRHYEDVTSEYTRLDRDYRVWRQAFETKLAARPPVDLGPLYARLDALEQAIRAIGIPPCPMVDNAPVRAGSRNLLTRAHYGAPDDLKYIKGVKLVMEKMLHDIGVYYFWQIAEWSSEDIEHADAQLTAFHGRIARDAWVVQATALVARPESARRPVEL